MLHFVHVSDTHLHPDPIYTGSYASYSSLQGARALVEQINALPFAPDFVLHTGDVVYDPVPEAYHLAKEIFGAIKYLVYYAAGNHDDSEALQRVLMGRAEIVTPLHYTVEVKGVQLAVVDSNGPIQPPAGMMTDGELAWLEAVCGAPDERPLVVAVHHNLTPTGVPWLDEHMGIANSDDLHRVLLGARNRLRGVFFGHVHQNIEVLRDGILYSGVLSAWNQFHAWPGMTDTTLDVCAEPGFNVVTVTRQQTFIRRYRFAVAAD